MSLSIIIVNYRSAKYVAGCIQSAMQFASGASFEWIVVDNDSKDNSKQATLTQFPFVQWIDMGYNAGFARANNKGMQQAKGDVVLLLNPDTIITDDAIEQCYSRFIQSAYVACSVQLLNADGSPQITGNYFMKGGLNHLLPLPYLGALLRAIAFSINVKKTNVPIASPEQKVDWINGAFMMVKKSAVEKAGMFDEDFFLYSEEIEWCSRLKRVGELCVYGNLYTTHLQGEAVNNAMQTSGKGYANLFDKKGLQILISQHVRIRKQFGAAWFLFHLFMHTIEIPIFFICSFIDHLVHLKNPFGDIKQVKGFTYNVFRLWGLAPAILGNQPHFYRILV